MMDIINRNTYKPLSRKKPLTTKPPLHTTDVFNRLYGSAKQSRHHKYVKTHTYHQNAKQSCSESLGEKTNTRTFENKVQNNNSDSISLRSSKVSNSRLTPEPSPSANHNQKKIRAAISNSSPVVSNRRVDCQNNVTSSNTSISTQNIMHSESNLQTEESIGMDVVEKPCPKSVLVVNKKYSNQSESVSTNISNQDLHKFLDGDGKAMVNVSTDAKPQTSIILKDALSVENQHKDDNFCDKMVDKTYNKCEQSLLTICKTNVPLNSSITTDIFKTSVKSRFGQLISKSKNLLDGVRYGFPYLNTISNLSNVVPLALPIDEVSVTDVEMEVNSSESNQSQVDSSLKYSHMFPECVCCVQAAINCNCPLSATDSTDLDDLVDNERTSHFCKILFKGKQTCTDEFKKNNINHSGPPSTNSSPRTDDDDEVAQDLDMHQLIISDAHHEPMKSADEVIQEINDIMQEGSSSEDEGIEDGSSSTKASEPSMTSLPAPLYHDKLKDLNSCQLNEILMELELTVRQYSETLISQLALRDELEYEKELKNTFISLLLQVQNKRRIMTVDKKKFKKSANGADSKYLTTVIPYDVRHKTPDNQTIQILIKILTAINEDSPTVPTLLTDYILKVLCPS